MRAAAAVSSTRVLLAALVGVIALALAGCGGTSKPASGAGLPAPGPALFAISSPLPVPMCRSAASVGLRTTVGSRGFAFNVTDSASLVRILEIGTRVSTRAV